MNRKTADSIPQRLKQAFTITVDESLSGLPVWFRIPVRLARNFPKISSPRKQPESVITKLRKSLTHEDVLSLVRIRKAMIDLMMEDRLELGGWGRRNNKVLRTFFGDLPDDFDTEGSITLTRWVVDAVAFSNLDDRQKSPFLDEKLNAYLDMRFNREMGASGRIGTPDLLGRRQIQPAPRHTATSILCYLGFDSERFLHCANIQVEYLINNRKAWVNNPEEVGHPDILRALFLARFHFFENDSPEKTAIEKLIKEGSTFFWNWLNSPSMIPKAFGPSAHLYLRLYSLCSISDLSVIKGFDDAFSPLQSFRKVVHRDLQEFCSGKHSNDHRMWGFRAFLLWSYLYSPPKDANIDDLKDLLLSIIDVGGDFRDGFCVYWAVLFAIADSIVGESDNT